MLAAAARAFDPRAAVGGAGARGPAAGGQPAQRRPRPPGDPAGWSPGRDATGSDVDLDATLAARGAEPHWRAEHLHTRGWRSTGRATVLLVDASGSVAGDELAAAVLTASALVQRMRPG